jgi:hemophore-related protein
MHQMKISAGRNVIASLIVGGFAAVAVMAGTGTSVAGPLDSPLVNSTCTFGQIDRALHAERPDLAARLDAHPQHRAMLEQLFNQPVPQRREQIQRYMQQHPDRVAQMQRWDSAHPQAAPARAALDNQLATTCHNY